MTLLSCLLPCTDQVSFVEDCRPQRLPQPPTLKIKKVDLAFSKRYPNGMETNVTRSHVTDPMLIADFARRRSLIKKLTLFGFVYILVVSVITAILGYYHRIQDTLRRPMMVSVAIVSIGIAQLWYWLWRCPKCNVFFGKQISEPAFCPQCGVQLVNDPEESLRRSSKNAFLMKGAYMICVVLFWAFAVYLCYFGRKYLGWSRASPSYR